jgi:hypothetical protein
MTRKAILRANVGDHGDMVAAILEVYGRATPEDCAAGRSWYGTAGRMVRAIAAPFKADPERVTFVLAALSPRNPWRWNVADAYAFVAAAGSGAETRPTATTFDTNADTAWRIANGQDGWTGAALKVRAFVRAIAGDVTAVVVDVWATKVATRGMLDRIKPAEYQYIADAYADAAAMVGETPADMQAITWIVAQREGMASRRRGRHDETFKRGTAPAVVALFESEVPNA